MQEALQEALKVILEIQELDMQLIQLMRLKKERQIELNNLNAIISKLKQQQETKNQEITEIKKDIRLIEGEVAEIQAKIKKLDSQQSSVKKLDEFNALTQEMSQAEKEKNAKEQRLSDLIDRLNAEEDAFKNLSETLDSTIQSSRLLETEIIDGIKRINDEGHSLKEQRDQLVQKADPEIFHIYERLLRNKKDRIVVPIENRCCSGCHIMITPQDENLVRKGERIVFCEHCSRIHYWQESKALEGTTVATRQRRKRAASTGSR